MAANGKLSGKRLQLYEIVFESDTPLGKTYDVVLLVCILASVIVVALESVPGLPESFGKWLVGLEWFFTIIF